MIEWSSSEPSPSGVACSFSRNRPKSCMWYVLILDSLSSRAGMFRWCDIGWCGSAMPISGYVRTLFSRPTRNVATRVRSAWYATAIKSNMSSA